MGDQGASKQGKAQSPAAHVLSLDGKFSVSSSAQPPHMLKEEQELSIEIQAWPFLYMPQDPRRSFRRPSYFTLMRIVGLVGTSFSPVFPAC